ncbi:hypothetical protein QTO34_004483 [Cnephaeus nilssonii]|uniref:Uncharacterized protein n=1 Tax=Cnephaeus nilssonii TaxID=3371016 RepID=A0AA40HQ97_CNENI|nr:hypothetical protein QTO34_004483 [Eptesicus nilssonii]
MLQPGARARTAPGLLPYPPLAQRRAHPPPTPEPPAASPTQPAGSPSVKQQVTAAARLPTRKLFRRHREAVTGVNPEAVPSPR